MKLPVADIERDLRSLPNLTSAQALARILLKKAIHDGSQAAIEAVLDRLEGKAGKGAQAKSSNEQLNDQLDVSLDSLNALTQE